RAVGGGQAGRLGPAAVLAPDELVDPAGGGLRCGLADEGPRRAGRHRSPEPLGGGRDGHGGEEGKRENRAERRHRAPREGRVSGWNPEFYAETGRGVTGRLGGSARPGPVAPSPRHPVTPSPRRPVTPSLRRSVAPPRPVPYIPPL